MKLQKNVIIELIIVISQFHWARMFLARIKAAALHRIVDYDGSWKDGYQDLQLPNGFYVQQQLDILTCTDTVLYCTAVHLTVPHDMQYTLH